MAYRGRFTTTSRHRSAHGVSVVEPSNRLFQSREIVLQLPPRESHQSKAASCFGLHVPANIAYAIDSRLRLSHHRLSVLKPTLYKSIMSHKVVRLRSSFQDIDLEYKGITFSTVLLYGGNSAQKLNTPLLKKELLKYNLRWSGRNPGLNLSLLSTGNRLGSRQTRQLSRDGAKSFSGAQR